MSEPIIRDECSDTCGGGVIEALRTWREITDAIGLTLEPWQWWVLALLCSEAVSSDD